MINQYTTKTSHKYKAIKAINNWIHTGCKYISVFTEFTIFFLAILEPLHQTNKHQTSTASTVNFLQLCLIDCIVIVKMVYVLWYYQIHRKTAHQLCITLFKTLSNKPDTTRNENIYRIYKKIHNVYCTWSDQLLAPMWLENMAQAACRAALACEVTVRYSAGAVQMSVGLNEG